MKMNFAKKATALAMSVLFAVSMAGCGSSASTAKKVEVTSVEDLADLKIGVQTGTTGDSQASDGHSLEASRFGVCRMPAKDGATRTAMNE